ncbi:MAG: 6-phosphogluconolactonase [Phycisphaerales bacterium]
MPDESTPPSPRSVPPVTPDAYALEREFHPPALPGEVVVRAELDDLHHTMGAELLIHAKNCVRAFGDFHLALSGGSTPLPFYRMLMTDPAFRDLPWKFTHLWVVDERCVPFDDERSNWGQLAHYFARHADIPEKNLHPMPATDPNGDVAYERTLREHLMWREKGQDRLDFVLLGMGADAHTASLFPQSPALRERERLIVFNDGEHVVPPPRMTMTYPLINASRYIAVLATGEKKAQTLRTIASDERPSVGEAPILGIEPVGGVLKWFLDGEACG